jgi:LDH2 family malate/lactate/ureidoglycolate dehydrogenase
MVSVPIDEARSLVLQLMVLVGHSHEDAGLVADHLIDAELRGLPYAGLSRAVSVAQKIRSLPEPMGTMAITHPSTVSTVIDGRNQTGYVVGFRTAQWAMRHAEEHGFGVSSCYNTWMTGMFAYYMEWLARAGLVALTFGSSDWRVAPFGSSEGRFGTNPLAFGFPSRSDPVVYDAAVSSTMVSDAVMHQRLGRPLDAGRAFDVDGVPTSDPIAALEGAFSVWGGHKGSGLGIVVQLFGLLAGAQVKPPAHKDCSMVVIAIRPDMLVDPNAFANRVADYGDLVRSARVLPGGEAIRMPFDRSLANRHANMAQGVIKVADEVWDELHRELDQAQSR